MAPPDDEAVSPRGHLDTGSSFGGDFRILGEAGSGAMGVVYRALHVRLDREVALKVISPAVVEREDFRERFDREARLVASLDHPNVVPVYDYGERDGQPYLVMKWLEGPHLGDLVRAEGPLDVGRITAIGAQLAEGLDAAHRRGLVHRDVKPSNVLVTHDDTGERAYLTDFGVAKALQAEGTELTRTGMVVGTPAYMAPEQVQTGQGDGRADLYAVGCLLFHAATGRAPFRGDTPMAIAMAHASEPRPRVSHARPDGDRRLDELVEQAMATDPADRFSTGRALAEALRAVGASPAGEPPTLPGGPRSRDLEPTVAIASSESDDAPSEPAGHGTVVDPVPAATPVPAAAASGGGTAPADATVVAPGRTAPVGPTASGSSHGGGPGAPGAGGRWWIAAVVLLVLVLGGVAAAVLAGGSSDDGEPGRQVGGRTPTGTGDSRATGGSRTTGSPTPPGSTTPAGAAGTQGGAPEQGGAPQGATPVDGRDPGSGTPAAGGQRAPVTPAQRGEAKQRVVAVLRRYETAFSNQSTDQLKFLMTTSVVRRGLAAGGCRTSTGRPTVLQDYRENFAVSSGPYTFTNLSPESVRVTSPTTATVAQAPFVIGSGARGATSFQMQRTPEGDWRMSRITANC